MHAKFRAGEAVPKTTDAEVACAMLSLEHEIACLASMTQILGMLLDDHLVDEDGSASGRELYRVLLGNKEMDLLSFAWNDVIGRARRLDRAFHEAVKGRILQ